MALRDELTRSTASASRELQRNQEQIQKVVDAVTAPIRVPLRGLDQIGQVPLQALRGDFSAFAPSTYIDAIADSPAGRAVDASMRASQSENPMLDRYGIGPVRRENGVPVAALGQITTPFTRTRPSAVERPQIQPMRTFEAPAQTARELPFAPGPTQVGGTGFRVIRRDGSPPMLTNVDSPFARTGPDQINGQLPPSTASLDARRVTGQMPDGSVYTYFADTEGEAAQDRNLGRGPSQSSRARVTPAGGTTTFASGIASFLASRAREGFENRQARLGIQAFDAQTGRINAETARVNAAASLRKAAQENVETRFIEVPHPDPKMAQLGVTIPQAVELRDGSPSRVGRPEDLAAQNRLAALRAMQVQILKAQYPDATDEEIEALRQQEVEKRRAARAGVQ